MELVRRNLARSRADAKRLIDQGFVVVGEGGTFKPSTMIDQSTRLEVLGQDKRWVSRGAQKLLGALEAFPIEVADKVAIDVGASTGGFTEVLLEAGAKRVTALDVGSDQLDPVLRSDPRVEVLEKTNVRYVTPTTIGGPFTLVVVDLSFISLSVVASQLAGLATDGADVVLLVKPQFEVQRADLAKGGILRDAAKRADAVRRVLDALDDAGLGCLDIMTSPLEGRGGNVEFLLWCRKGAGSEDLEVPC